VDLAAGIILHRNKPCLVGSGAGAQAGASGEYVSEHDAIGENTATIRASEPPIGASRQALVHHGLLLQRTTAHIFCPQDAKTGIERCRERSAVMTAIQRQRREDARDTWVFCLSSPEIRAGSCRLACPIR
jgi:hypothetical protein